MIKTFKTALLSSGCALCLALAPLAAKATGIPVFDASNMAKALAQIEAMARDYQNQLDQLDAAISQAEALTGTRGMGDLMNSQLERELRRYLPNTWQETMNMMQGAPGSASGAATIYRDLHSAYQPITGAEFVPSDPAGPMAKALDRASGTTYASMAASEAAYNNTQKRIETYERLMDELNNTQDLKASVDLLGRIAAENGLLMSELMRLNAIDMQQAAASNNQSLTGYRRTLDANDFDAGGAAKVFERQATTP
jgi:type IV secretion system protein VirB5